MILDCFTAASSLLTNVDKCQFTPIRCSDDQITLVHDLFPCHLIHFPCKYLGVPLSIYQLKKGDLQLLLDCIAARPPP
jgi:hypothetical protein